MEKDSRLYENPAESLSEVERLHIRVARLEQSNALLVAREARYRELIEHTHDMIWTVDIAGSVTFLNSACQTITGYSKQEILGKDLSDLVAPENLEDARATVTRRWDGERPRHYEIRILAKNGAPVDLEVSSSLIRRNGAPAGAIAIARDVTARKRAQESLRQNAENFEYLFSSHPMPIWVFDLRTQLFLEVNEAAVEKYGYSRQEFLSMSAAVLSPPDEARRLAAHVREIEPGAHGSASHWRHLTKSGRIVDGEVFWRTVVFAGKDAVLSVIHDITERRLLEEQLRQAQKLEAVGRLAGGIAHDFNNLLTVIAGYAQLLLNRINTDHPMHTGLDQIRQSSDKAAALTRQLLAFSRRQSLQPGILDLNEVIAGMETMLVRMIGERIQLATRLSPDLGCVHADPSQIEQIILNLVLNARDAMPNGGCVTLETASAEFQTPEAASGHEPGCYAMLAVTDTGKGIDRQIRGLLFDPFFTTKHEREGSGLGLSAVYGMVEQHKGFIRVSSEPGHGARFEVYLPIPDPREIPASEAAGVRGRETILVVEDQPGILRLLGETLRLHGYNVLECASGAAALEMVGRELPRVDLLLADIVMPGVDGLGVAKAWQAVHPDLRVVFMSGYAEHPMLHQESSGFGSPLLRKPFSGAALAKAVREALDAPAFTPGTS